MKKLPNCCICQAKLKQSIIAPNQYWCSNDENHFFLEFSLSYEKESTYVTVNTQRHEIVYNLKDNKTFIFFIDQGKRKTITYKKLLPFFASSDEIENFLILQ